MLFSNLSLVVQVWAVMLLGAIALMAGVFIGVEWWWIRTSARRGWAAIVATWRELFTDAELRADGRHVPSLEPHRPDADEILIAVRDGSFSKVQGRASLTESAGGRAHRSRRTPATCPECGGQSATGALMALVKQQETADQIETLFGDAVTAAPSPVRLRCADCGWLEAADQMWFVPTGKHPLFHETRAICRDCRDVRLEAQQHSARSGAMSAPATRPRSESAEGSTR